MTSPTDSQTPESRELRQQLADILERYNERFLQGFEEYLEEGDENTDNRERLALDEAVGMMESILTAEALAAQKALLADVNEVIDNYFKQFGAGTPLKITRELAALERQHLGKEGSDE